MDAPDRHNGSVRPSLQCSLTLSLFSVSFSLNVKNMCRGK